MPARFILAIALAAVGFPGALLAQSCAEDLRDDPGDISLTTLVTCVKEVAAENAELRAELDAIELTPGPEGPQGPQGDVGQTGRAGSNAEFPSGAVVAFDRPDMCPSGWTDMGNRWRGHALVAAVSDTNDKYGFRRTGGAETHTLTIDEMPSHNHGGDTGTETPTKLGRYFWYDAGVPSSFYTDKIGSPIVGLDNTTKHTHSIPSQGNGGSHNNMPPYVAIYFCKKN